MSDKSYGYRDAIVFEKLRPHEHEKLAFSNSSGLESF